MRARVLGIRVTMVEGTRKCDVEVLSGTPDRAEHLTIKTLLPEDTDFNDWRAVLYAIVDQYFEQRFVLTHQYVNVKEEGSGGQEQQNPS